MNRRTADAIPIGVGGLGIGFLLGLTMSLPTGYDGLRSVSPIALTAKQLTNTEMETTLPEMDVVISLVSQAEIEKKCVTKGGLVGIACTHPYERPCHVYLPVSSTAVRFWPNQEEARWANYDVASNMERVLPHELLHCVYPNWHQPWTNVNDPGG